jgi:hypothetical protein
MFHLPRPVESPWLSVAVHSPGQLREVEMPAVGLGPRRIGRRSSGFALAVSAAEDALLAEA